VLAPIKRHDSRITRGVALVAALIWAFASAWALPGTATSSAHESSTPTVGIAYVTDTVPPAASPSASPWSSPTASDSPQAAPSTASKPTDPLRFVAFGDSLTYRGSWPAAVDRASPRLKLVRMAGVSMNTTAQMLARLQHDVLAYRPNVVTVLGGTNDRFTGVPKSAFIANLRTIIDQLKAHGVTVILMTIPPNKAGSVTSWNDAIRDIARTEGVALVDIYAVLANSTGGWAKGMTGDGIHPDAAGYARMTTAILAVTNNLFPPDGE